MGTNVVQGNFRLGESCAVEARRRGVHRSTVLRDRADQPLPPFARAVDGRIVHSRQLSSEQRNKRNRRIQQMLRLGITWDLIEQTMGVSTHVIAEVAKRTPRRRKQHKLSRRAWSDRLPTTG